MLDFDAAPLLDLAAATLALDLTALTTFAACLAGALTFFTATLTGLTGLDGFTPACALDGADLLDLTAAAFTTTLLPLDEDPLLSGFADLFPPSGLDAAFTTTLAAGLAAGLTAYFTTAFTCLTAFWATLACLFA